MKCSVNHVPQCGEYATSCSSPVRSSNCSALLSPSWDCYYSHRQQLWHFSWAYWSALLPCYCRLISDSLQTLDFSFPSPSDECGWRWESTSCVERERWSWDYLNQALSGQRLSHGIFKSFENIQRCTYNCLRWWLRAFPGSVSRPLRGFTCETEERVRWSEWIIWILIQSYYMWSEWCIVLITVEKSI